MGMDVLVMRFTLRSRGMELPGFAGSIWHGGLGCQLNRVAPTAFARLYQVSDEARLYSLVAPEGGHWPAGQDRVLQLSLFGPACSHAMAVVQAVAELGEVGLRPGGRFAVEAIDTIAPDGQDHKAVYSKTSGLSGLPLACDLTEAWANARKHQLPQLADVRLQLLSPLRIKEHNTDVRHAPTCVQLLRRALSRVEQLAYACKTDLDWVRDGRTLWLSQAAAIAPPNDAPMEWAQLERRSARSSQSMFFGGLVGELHYTQVTPDVRAWLQMIHGLQVGGKTAFGFGGAQVSVVTPSLTFSPPRSEPLHQSHTPAPRHPRHHTQKQESHETHTE
jgi:hypothetical protein